MSFVTTYTLFNRTENDPEAEGRKILGLPRGKLDQFIKDNSLKKSKETDECILDLNHFLKNRKLRREDSWQS